MTPGLYWHRWRHLNEEWQPWNVALVKFHPSENLLQYMSIGLEYADDINLDGSNIYTLTPHESHLNPHPVAENHFILISESTPDGKGIITF